MHVLYSYPQQLRQQYIYNSEFHCRNTKLHAVALNPISSTFKEWFKFIDKA